MIIVTVQYVDGQVGSMLYNGGSAIQFYNVQEAILFAQNESARYPGTPAQTEAVCKVYNDGVIVSVWLDGVDITG